MLASFWMILIVPWLIDINSGGYMMSSVFGAVLWGAAVVLAVVRARTKDHTLLKNLSVALVAVSGCWLLAWLVGFLEGARQNSMPEHSIRLINLAHSGLLAAAVGMVLALWVASLLWIIKETSLRKRSWERRNFKSKLPSLEALSKFCHGALIFAFSTWVLGLALAVVAAHKRWQGEGSWLLQGRILFTFVMLGILIAAVQLRFTLPRQSRWLYRFYGTLSTLFLVLFAWFISSGHPVLNEPIRWFVR